VATEVKLIVPKEEVETEPEKIEQNRKGYSQRIPQLFFSIFKGGLHRGEWAQDVEWTGTPEGGAFPEIRQVYGPPDKDDKVNVCAPRDKKGNVGSWFLDTSLSDEEQRQNITSKSKNEKKQESGPEREKKQTESKKKREQREKQEAIERGKWDAWTDSVSERFEGKKREEQGDIEREQWKQWKASVSERFVRSMQPPHQDWTDADGEKRAGGALAGFNGKIMIFKNGANGIGYYADDWQAVQQPGRWIVPSH
jgi:hypothetical protein